MKYNEMIFNICTDTDLDDREDVIDSMNYLAREAIKMYSTVEEYDNKLKEIMTAKDYLEWTEEIAKRLFRLEIDMMPEGDFKDFCNEHFDEVTE